MMGTFGDDADIDAEMAAHLPDGFRTRTSPDLSGRIYYIARSDDLIKIATASGNGGQPAGDAAQDEEVPEGPAGDNEAGDAGAGGSQKTEAEDVRPAPARTPGLPELQELLWKDLPDAQQDVIAQSYFRLALRRELESMLTSPIPSAPLLGLASALPQNEQVALYRRLALIQAARVENDYIEDMTAGNAAARVATAKARIVEEAATQMGRWTTLSKIAPKVLIFGTIFAAVMIAIVLIAELSGAKLDGPSTALVIFVLALFAVSPAVLLLIERPLAGLDQWSPSGASKSDDKGDDAEAEQPEGNERPSKTAKKAGK